MSDVIFASILMWNKMLYCRELIVCYEPIYVEFVGYKLVRHTQVETVILMLLQVPLHFL